jgi:hypothetical protein
VSVPSLGKSIYYVSFIDDFSRKTWIYFLRKKSEVLDRFKEFKALVENQTEKRIKVLRTDNGGEFCGNEFEEFCKKCGIARQKTTPYTPQQNGVAERMNRTLMEKARCMLSGARIGQELWAEAVGIACYLVNRSPSSALGDKTPQEVWTGKEPSLTHLKVFGCDAYVHVPKENRSKLDKKAEKCIFIGYKDGLKGYKLWNPETKKVVYRTYFRRFRADILSPGRHISGMTYFRDHMILGGFRHMVFADGFLFPVKELGFWTNPGHWVRVLDAAGSYMYIVL